jgi:acyl carrier protein
LAQLGIEALPPETGLAALEVLMAQQMSQAAVAKVDWARLFRSDAAAAASRLLSELVRDGAETAAAETELTLRLRSSPTAARRGIVLSYLAETAGEVLRLSSPVDPSRSLFELGLDSILALELTGRISEACGRPFRGTVLFTHPTVESLAGYVLDELSLPVAGGTRPEEEELAELIAQEIEGR